LYAYINGNEYVYRGLRHSIIILIYFSWNVDYNVKSLRIPRRLFYHSLDCGYWNIFPNQVFLSDPLYNLRHITDQKHSIHHRQLTLAMRRSISTPKYAWDRHYTNINPDHCLASRWDELSQTFLCDFNQFAVQHYQLFLNFTAITKPPVHVPNYGELLTYTQLCTVKDSISLHEVDSANLRALYCDRNSDSPRLRPISLSSPFSFETWVTLGFLLLFCAIASSFTIFDTQSDSKIRTSISFLRTIFNSISEIIICLLEKDMGRKIFTKALIGLIVICVGNDYKNYLTIELVFPRASEAISTLTELLDLNFNLLQPVNVKQIGNVKLPYLKELNYHLEIDEPKREKYVREVERWWKLILFSDDSISNEPASATSKNAWIVNAPYHIQVYNLSLITQRNYPLSCHFVRSPFAHQFRELYFFNPKAEEFKWWTTKFLDHGLFVFWKRLESQAHLISALCVAQDAFKKVKFKLN
jgi:hypothetical protein